MSRENAAMVVAIPSRGRFDRLLPVLRFLARTRTAETTTVVISNGPQPLPDPNLDGVRVVHIGDIPTIPVAVNFGWYALRSAQTILMKLDNDVLPQWGWETEIRDMASMIDLGGLLCTNQFEPTPEITIRNRVVRQPHYSHTWGIPFLYGGCVWLSPALAEELQYIDERFVRSNDGELGERTSRSAGRIMAYSRVKGATHLSAAEGGSTELPHLKAQLYDACDQLIAALPPRPLAMDTIWTDVMPSDEARDLVLTGGRLPPPLECRARDVLATKLHDAFALVGRRDLVDILLR